MNQCLVSVVMSVYNEQEYLEDTMESILKQTFRDFEFVIVNDGSTDGTKGILDSYAKKDRRVRLVTNERNLGLTRSLNKGIDRARGKYIARIDAGDTAHPDRFRKQLKVLEENEDVWIVGTWAYWVNEKKEVIGQAAFPLFVDSNGLFKTGGAIHPSLMIRRDLFEKTGPYNERYGKSQDFELYMRTIRNRRGISNIPEFLTSVMNRYTWLTPRLARTAQVNQFKIKATYLPSLCSLWNIVYTVRSLVGCLLPICLLRRLGDRRIRNMV